MLGKLRIDTNLILLPFLLMIVLAPLFHDGFFQTVSGALPIYSLLSLEAKPGLAAEGGNLPLAYYVAEVLKLWSRNDVVAIKAVFGLGLLLSGLGTYFFANRLFGSLMVIFRADAEAEADEMESRRGAALLASVLYACAPFYLASIYVLGDLSIITTFVLLPWTALTFSILGADSQGQAAALSFWRRTPFLFVPACLSLGLLVVSNPGVGILFGLYLLAISGYVSPSGISRWKFAAVAAGCMAGITILLSGLYAGIPISKRVSNGGFVDFSQLFSPVWGYGQLPSGGLPVQVGVVQLALFAMVAAGLLSKKRVARSQSGSLSSRKDNLVPWQFATILALIVFVVLTLPASQSVWRFAGSVAIDPFHLLAPATFLVALLGATVPLQLSTSRRFTSTALVLAAVVSIYGYLTPRYIDISETRHYVNAVFGDVVLLDYDVKGDANGKDIKVSSEDGKIDLTLYWQAIFVPKSDLTVFTHVKGANGKLWGQQDNKPVRGIRPTNTWQTGEVVVDRYSIQLAKDTPPGDYLLEVGLYDATTGERVNVSTGKETDLRLLLDKVTID